jgi:hypothetical protein
LRRAARKDENHNEITEYLQSLGWSVHDTSGLGYGFPDALVGKPEFCCVVEIKDGNKSPSERKLTAKEQAFKDNWTGPYVLAVSPEDAAAQLDALYAKVMSQ